jgi:hypothetical protein
MGGFDYEVGLTYNPTVHLRTSSFQSKSYSIQSFFPKEEKMADNVWIPEVSNEVLRQLAARIKVIVDRGEDKYYIKWEGLWGGDKFFYDPDLDKLVDQSELSTLRDITTYHPVFSEYMFEPRFVDVLAQIPEKLRDQVFAIEIVDYPETHRDVGRNPKEFKAGYYVAVTRLYSKLS